MGQQSHARRRPCLLTKARACRDVQRLPAYAGQHIGPFSLCVPMQASDATHISSTRLADIE